MGLKESLLKIEGRFGKGTVMKMSDKPIEADRVPVDSLKINMILGGGYAKGKIIEIYSEEACGKTGLALEIIKSVQDSGGTAVVIDAEHALNAEYARKIGVNFDDLYIAQPTCGEDAFEIAREFIRSGGVDCIVFDSVSALIPKAELDGETGESKMGLQARMMSQAMRQITGAASTNECTLVFLNQLREKIGVMYGDPKTTTGGNALKFYASQRLKVTKSAYKEGTEVVGMVQKVTVTKNKLGVPFKTAERIIRYDTGINSNAEIVDVAVELGIIKQKGSWFIYGDVNLGQGMARVLEIFADNDELKEEILKKIREA